MRAPEMGGARPDAPAPGPPATPRPGWAPYAERLAQGPVIAAVSYHSTPARRRAQFAAEVARLAARFDPLDEAGLDAILDGRRPPRPVVMPILYEGFRDNHDVMLPLLEAHGLTAWLMIPPGFLDLDAQDQRPYAAAHHLDYPGDEYPSERITMDWAEVRAAVARGHVVGCHSRGHSALAPDTPDETLEWEIAGGQALMRRRLGRPSRLFCWLRGAAAGHNPRADAVLRREGFDWLLSNLAIQRLPRAG